MVMEIRDAKITPGYKLTEVGLIPDDWVIATLGEIVNKGRPICYGIVQTGKIVNNGVPCIRVIDLNNGKINKENLITTSKDISDSYKRTILKEGDLVIALRGKIGELAIIDQELTGANLTRGLALIAVNTSLDSYFFLQQLSSSNSKTIFERNLNGSALQEIPINVLKKIPVAYPRSKFEQHAIATALSDVDALITSLDKLIAKKRDIKQATMQKLLTGKMRLPGFSGELKTAYKQTELGMIPEDWGTYSLGDIVTKVGSGITPRGGEKVYKKSGRPFLRSQNVGWGHLLLDDIVFIDEETHSSFSSTEIKHNDVLLNITGASIGRSAVADNRLLGGNVNQHVSIIRVDASKLNPYYLNLFLLSKFGQKQIESFQAGGNRQGLNFGQIKSFQIPLPEQKAIPSLPEQQAIATVLTDMDAEVAALEQRREKTRMLKQGMMQELLTGKTRLV